MKLVLLNHYRLAKKGRSRERKEKEREERGTGKRTEGKEGD